MQGRLGLLLAAVLATVTMTAPLATAGPAGATEITLDAPSQVLVGDNATLSGQLHEQVSGRQFLLGGQPVEVRVTCDGAGDGVHSTRTELDGSYRVDHRFPAEGDCTVRAIAWPGTPQATASEPVEVTVGGELTASVDWGVCPAPGHEGSGLCLITWQSNTTMRYDPGTEVNVTAYFDGQMTLDGEGVTGRTIDWNTTLCRAQESASAAVCTFRSGEAETGGFLGFWHADSSQVQVTVPDDACYVLEGDVDAEYRVLQAHGAGTLRICPE